MSSARLSSLPVELFERILEYLDIFDVVRLKLLDHQAYRIICCSNHIKYRIELFLAGLEDGNHYSLAERQQFLHSYQSSWDNLTPQKTTTIAVPGHGTYELAGGVYGLVPSSSPNSIQFYRLPSVSRGIEMEEWSVRDLEFSVDDFTMECAYDLLAALVYKSGRVKVHLLKLSDGKPHPRAKMPLLEHEIPFSPTESGWELEVIIWENKLGCLFTSALDNEWVDNLVVWDWTTGKLVQILSQCGNRTFTFLDEDTIVAGRAIENTRPSLSFFNLSSDEYPITPFLTLALPDEEGEDGGSSRIRFNLGIPIRSGPELRARLPFFVDPSRQMLFIFTFFVDPDAAWMTESHSIAIPFSVLRSWARAGVPLVGWDDWKGFSVEASIDDPCRATFSMGSRFVTPNFDAQPRPTSRISTPLLVYNLSPYRRMRVGWESSGSHCRGIPGVWNAVTLIQENGGHCRATEMDVEPTISDLLMTEDALIAVVMDDTEQSLRILSF